MATPGYANTNNPAPPLLTEKVIDAMTCAGLALERLEQGYLVKKAQDEKLAALRPAVSKHLIASGLIEENEKEELDRVLMDPVLTLELLGKSAQYHGQAVSEFYSSSKQAAAQSNGNGYHNSNGSTIGTVVDPSQAQQKRANNYPVPGSADHPYAGARTSQLKESDKAYYRNVLGYEPEE